MANLKKCEKCDKTIPAYSEDKWIYGRIDSACWSENEKDNGLVGGFDLCPQCAQPLLKFFREFFRTTKES